LYRLEKKVFAQVRFFEELTLIKDDHGEVLFTGSAEMAEKILKLLNKDRKAKRKTKKGTKR
jgi:hypothetical protein